MMSKKLKNSEVIIGPYDILSGRGRDSYQNVGNRRFRVTIAMSLQRYIDASTRLEKSKVILSVVDLIRSSGGRFLKWINNRSGDGGYWVELNERRVREKVGHALRDMAISRNLVTATRVSPSKRNVGVSSENRSHFYTEGGANQSTTNDNENECFLEFTNVRHPSWAPPKFRTSLNSNDQIAGKRSSLEVSDAEFSKIISDVIEGSDEDYLLKMIGI